MGKLLLKLLVVLAWIIGLAWMQRQSLPPYWGNEDFTHKYEYFREHATEHTMLFVGSSVIYRHLVPTIFNNNAPASLPTNAFNLGVSAASPPEQYYLLDVILNDPELDLSNIKVIIVDLEETTLVRGQNASTSRVKYFMNPNMLQRTLALLPERADQDAGPEEEWSYIKATAGWALNLGMTEDMLAYKAAQALPDSLKEYPELGNKLDGFRPLDRDFRFRTRSEEFHGSDVEEYHRRIANATTRYLDQWEKAPDEEAMALKAQHTAEALYYIEAFKARGIHLIWLVPPRYPLPKIYPLAYSLPREHWLAVVDPREHEKLFDSAFAFDRGHYNLKGAQWYSRQVVKELKPLLDSLGQEATLGE